MISLEIVSENPQPKKRSEKSPAPECPVCCEPFNKSTRISIECMCKTKICRACIKKYMLSRPEDAHCMNCKVAWNQKFLFDHFEKVFLLKEWKIYRENILLDREKSMFPATQPHIEKIIRIENMEEVRLQIMEKIRNLQSHLNKIHRAIENEHGNKVDTKDAKYLHKCPQTDCHGFLSQQWSCQLCKTIVCRDCREIKCSPEHQCNPNTVATVALVARDSKPCPKCSTFIYRISGCNSMFCTSCHTAFHWDTLRIETRNVHNPHYFEWLRTRDEADHPVHDVDLTDPCVEIDNRFNTRVKSRLVEDFMSLEFDNMNEYLGRIRDLFHNQTNLYPTNRKTAQHISSIQRVLDNVITGLLNRRNDKCLELEKFIYSRMLEALKPDGSTSPIMMALKDMHFKPSRDYANEHVQILFLCMRVQHMNAELAVLTRDCYNDNLNWRIKLMRHQIDEAKFKSVIQKKEHEAMRMNEVRNIVAMFTETVTDYLRRWMRKEIQYDDMIPDLRQLSEYSARCYRETLLMYGSTKRTAMYQTAEMKFAVER